MKTAKKFLVVLLSVLMLFTFLSVSALAAEANTTPEGATVTSTINGAASVLEGLLNEIRQIISSVRIFFSHLFGKTVTVDLYNIDNLSMAEDGDTVKLAVNIKAENVRIARDVDINLNGHTITCNEFTVEDNADGSLIITNGIINTANVFNIQAPEQTVTIENTNIVSGGTVSINVADLILKDNDGAEIDCDRFIFNSTTANEVNFAAADITGKTSVDITVPNGALNLSDTDIESEGMVVLTAAAVVINDDADISVECDRFIFNSDTNNKIGFRNADITGKTSVEILVPNGTLNLSDIDVESDGVITLDASMNTINIGGNTNFKNTLDEKSVPVILDNTRVLLSAETELTEADFAKGNNVIFDITYSEANADRQVLTVEGSIITGLTEYGKTLTEIIVPDMINSNAITEIGVGAFSPVDIATTPTTVPDEAYQLTNVILPDSIEKIGSSAFYFCKGIVNFEFPANLKEISESAFKACSTLTEVILPEGIETLGNNAFYSCRGITNLYLPEGLKSIGKGTFNFCRGLTSITIPSTVKSMGTGAFANCSALRTAELKNSPTSIPANFMQACPLYDFELPESVTYIGTYAFANAFTADSIIALNDGIITVDTCAFSGALMNTFVFSDSVEELGDKVLFNCPNLTYVQFGSGLASIGTQMFRGCGKLEQVNFADDAPLSEIPYQTFYGCSGLKEVNITRNITAIATEAFRSCTGLQAPFFIPLSVTSIGSNAFRSVPTAIFRCEAASKPAGWVDAWSAKNILWGQTA